jgi:ketosteroid isomerase-like protein
MGQENVEIVRAAAEAYERRDIPNVLDALDPDVELFPARAVLEGEAYRGHEGFKRFLEDMSEDWEEFTAHPEEYRELEDGRVLVLGRFSGRGRSGVEIDAPAAWTSELSAGKIVRLRFYGDPAAVTAGLE